LLPAPEIRQCKYIASGASKVANPAYHEALTPEANAVLAEGKKLWQAYFAHY